MHTYQIKSGMTNVSIELEIIDETSRQPELGVVFNTAGMDLKYRRDGGAVVSITEATLAALTTAHADGGFLEIGNGVYRLDLPDAACATAAGVNKVVVFGTVTGMIVIPAVIQLVAYDPFNSEDLGLSAMVLHEDYDPAKTAATQVSVDDAGEEIGEIHLLIDDLPTTLLDLANGIETGLTLRQALRLLAAAAAGKLSGAATTTVTIRNAVADSKARITATVDGDGNRTAITTDVI